MHRLFGKPKAKVEAPTLDDTSSGMSARMKDLDGKIKGLDDEMRRYKEALQKTPTGPAAANIKRRAMDTLKRKRMYEAQRDNLASQQFNIDQTNFAISSIKDTQTTVMAMKAAAKTLKVEQKKINLNDLENMQDEMEDMLEDVGEISEILGRAYGTPDGIDEADLDAELAFLGDELESEMVGEDVFASSAPAPVAAAAPALPQPGYASTLPATPNTAQANTAVPIPQNINLI